LGSLRPRHVSVTSISPARAQTGVTKAPKSDETRPAQPFPSGWQAAGLGGSTTQASVDGGGDFVLRAAACRPPAGGFAVSSDLLLRLSCSPGLTRILAAGQSG